MTTNLIITRMFSIATLLTLSACSTYHSYDDTDYMHHDYNHKEYEDRLPPHVHTNGQKLVLINPRVHAWGAYGEDGNLVRGGIATAGGVECPPDDGDEPTCRTSVGTFKIFSLGDDDCVSKIYPKPEGGGLMPYCMYFHNGEALHGSPDPTVIEANVSHGCVRMRIPDAAWMRNNFAEIGTTVKVLPYD